MLPEPLTRLVEQLQRLPGIGAKSAQRLAFHMLRNPREDADRLCDAIRDVKERVTYCSVCNNITDTDPCAFCSGGRDVRQICVVEEPQNVTVVMNGAKQVQSLVIDPTVVSKDDVEMLQDMIVAALNDAQRKVDERLSQSMSGLMGGLKIPGLS